jgi:predicted ATPase
VPFVAAERARLHELRLVAEERSAEVEIDAGREAGVVGRLTELAAAHPEREHLCDLLMRALYRTGRQVEALDTFRRHRRWLADELGVEPADELVALEGAILRHDRGLSPAPPGNLRLPVSSFVGRAEELRRTGEALREPGPVTLTGPGGVGKTRLAMEAAAAAAPDFPGGCWIVDLSGVRDPRLVVHQVAVTLAVGDPRDDDEEATVVAALSHRDPLVLVLDNCEHLIAPCALLVDRLARTCPATRVLATSRQPLGVDGEHLLVVAPLPETDACRLFEERVRRAGVDDADLARLRVADLCVALDGLPLAVELAAGQLRALGPEELTARLDARLQFVNRRFDAPDRQRTLRDLVAWSHALLPAETQRVFDRLGVFASTLTADAVAAVCSAEPVAGHLTTLVDASLLAREPGTNSPVRFRLLDTLRLFALERLAAAGIEDEVRAAHARFHLDLIEGLRPQWHGPGQEDAIRRIDAEEANVHAALDWSAEHDPALGVRLALALWPYWDLRWRERFGVAYLTRLLDRHASALTDSQRAWALTVVADLAANPGEIRLARRPAEEAIALFRDLGDVRGLAAALIALAYTHRDEGALDLADNVLGEARQLADRLDDQPLLARADMTAWAIASRRGSADAERLARAEVDRFVALGSRRGEATAMRHVAVTLRDQGDLDEATRLCEAVLAVWEELGERPAVAHAQTTLADIARERGDQDGAVDLYERALVDLRAVGDRRCTASTYRNLAVLASAAGDHDRSIPLLRDAIGLRCELGDYAGLAECFTALADALAARGGLDEAVVLLTAADERRRVSGVAPSPEEVRAAARVESRRRDAGAPATTGRAPTLQDILGLELWRESSGGR